MCQSKAHPPLKRPSRTGCPVSKFFLKIFLFIYSLKLIFVKTCFMGDKFVGIDGYAVSANIDESDVLHVVSDMEYALDLGDGESYTSQGYVDCMAGEISFNAEVVDFDKEAFEELFFVDYKRVNDVFDEISRGISRVSMGIDEEYTTPKCDMLIEGDERAELLHGVSVTFKRNVDKN